MAHNRAYVIFDTHQHEYVSVHEDNGTSRTHMLCYARFFDSAKDALTFISTIITLPLRNQMVVRDVAVMVWEHTSEGDEI